MSDDMKTIRLTVALKAPAAMNIDHLDDEDHEHVEAFSLDEHLSLYIGAALEGLRDREGNEATLGYVVVADVIDGLEGFGDVVVAEPDDPRSI